MKYDSYRIPSNPDFFEVVKKYFSSDDYEYDYDYDYDDVLEDYDDNFIEKRSSKWRDRPRRSNHRGHNEFEDYSE